MNWINSWTDFYVSINLFDVICSCDGKGILLTLVWVQCLSKRPREVEVMVAFCWEVHVPLRACNCPAVVMNNGETVVHFSFLWPVPKWDIFCFEGQTKALSCLLISFYVMTYGACISVHPVHCHVFFTPRVGQEAMLNLLWIRLRASFSLRGIPHSSPKENCLAVEVWPYAFKEIIWGFSRLLLFYNSLETVE